MDAASKNICLGMIAHVDAGKTTLSEALLYRAGAIRTLGRVDHKNAHLDTHELERSRGITIFSKQARFSFGGRDYTLLDTPGHVDFSTETERTLPVLDAAVLVISGTDGVQAHTETLWELLRRYEVPAFIFVTKMDLPGAEREKILAELKARLDPACVDFGSPESERLESVALCDEETLESYLETGTVSPEKTRELIAKRRLFPCLFGSGLRLDGVDELLSCLDRFAPAREYPPQFGALVYKIMRDAQGNRLTCMRITGGSLAVRSPVSYIPQSGESVTEKISAIRLYSGAKFENAESVPAGAVCAVQGLSLTYPGQGLGWQTGSAAPVLEPTMTYRVSTPPDCDARTLLPKLRQLEEEDPQLHIVWNENLREIHLQLMGEVQIEVLESLISERFDVAVKIDSGHILYKETIASPVEGAGHFEPLRHYAEVHLLLSPAPRGTGISFDTRCSSDSLDRNWQRLILTHLSEKEHVGVLTGSPLTDVSITLLAGRAHPKHTEGGDFRQATYRAVRQGLMKAESVLLEPYYSFRLAVPSEQTGRAISDVRAMSGTFSAPETEGELSVITGKAPVARMRDYAAEVAAYTRGRGRLSCSVCGYEPCHNASEVIESMGYDPERDTENPSGSVFCSHGAGVTVAWDKADGYMHVETGWGREDVSPPPRMFRRSFDLDDRELEEIMEREFGAIRRPEYRAPISSPAPDARAELFRPRRERLIVDGYNVIFSWDELKPLAEDNLDLARVRLMDMLSNYASFTGSELALVFDGYKVRGGRGEKFDYHGIHVAYTRENETADAYIEKLADEIGRNESVRVVTSDSLIQLSAFRSGVLRTSAREFRSEVTFIAERMEEALRRSNGGVKP